ncbi:MAG: hypothetical protein WCT37_02520 [Patescibacteria group bacterium]|jgi:amidophosphoribosyltransferase
MCAIVGLIKRKKGRKGRSITVRLVKSLKRLKNRGSLSAGITVEAKDGYFIGHRNLGAPKIVFNQFPYGEFEALMGVGQNRYATAGDNSPAALLRCIQPLGVDVYELVQNGNILNVDEVRHFLQEQGKVFNSESDGEVMLRLFLFYLEKEAPQESRNDRDYARKVFAAIKKANRHLNGGWSVIIMSPRGLIVWRDPHGLRPVCLGRRFDEVGKLMEISVVSESSALNQFGDYHLRGEEIRPGEVLFITRRLTIHRKRLSHCREAFCFFEFAYFALSDSCFKDRYVEVVRKKWGEILGQETVDLCGKVDVVIGIPGSAVSAGIALARVWNVPYEQAIIKTDSTRSFQETSDEKRLQAIDDKFIFIRHWIEGKRVAIVDDSNVRGNTSKKIIERLFRLGAKTVDVLYYTPPIIGSCFYGIDTPQAEKLIANRCHCDLVKIAEELAELCPEHRGDITVRYISLAGLLAGMDLPANQLCLACVTGEYPTICGKKKTAEVIAAQGQRREKERAAG